MEDHPPLIKTFFEQSEHYMKTSAELFKLKAIDKSADIISNVMSRLVIAVFIVLFFFILNIGISLWIGEALGKTYYGFFIVAGFYGFAGLLCFAFRDTWIKSPVRNSIITHALN